MSRTSQRVVLLAAISIGWDAGPARAQQADLGAVPDDAVFMAHIRASDLWRSEAFKEFRAVVDRSGPKALEIYTRRFPISPALIDRVTLFAIRGPAGNSNAVLPLAVFALNKPIDQAKLVGFLMPNARPQTFGNAGVFSDGNLGISLHALDPQNVLVGPTESVKAYFSRPRESSGVMTAAKEVAARKHFTLGLNLAALPADALREVPPPFQPIVKARLAGVTVNIDSEVTLNIGLKYADSDAVVAAEKSIRDGIAMARAKLQESKKEVGKALLDPATPAPAPLRELPETLASLLGLAAIGFGDDVLDKLPLNREASNISIQASFPVHAMPPAVVVWMMAGVGYFGMRTAEMRGFGDVFAGNEAKAMNNMKQIALAMHNYESAYGNLPGHAIYSKDGKTPLLSWRVAILPFIEQDRIYRQFKLDEPWDSEHNLKLAATMPLTYASPNAPPTKDGNLTHYQIFVGGGAGWDRKPQGARFPDITDGTSNTIMVVQAADPVLWTKPEDIDYDPKAPLPKLGANPDSDNILFAMFDGSVHRKPKSLAENTLRAAITRAGGEVLDNWYDERPSRRVPVPPPSNRGVPKSLPSPSIPPRN